MIHVADPLKPDSGEGDKTLIVRNGGIAAMTRHFRVDLTKNARLHCVNCNEAYLITCFANEYVYEQWTEKVINFCGDVDDLFDCDLFQRSFREYTERCQDGPQ